MTHLDSQQNPHSTVVGTVVCTIASQQEGHGVYPQLQGTLLLCVILVFFVWPTGKLQHVKGVGKYCDINW